MINIKFIIRYLLMQKKLMSIGIFFIVLDVGFCTLQIITQKWILNSILQNNYHKLILFIFMFVLSWVASSLIFYFNGKILQTAVCKIKEMMNIDLIKKLLKMPTYIYVSKPISKYFSLFTCIDNIQSSLLLFPNKISTILKIIVFSIVLFTYDKKILIVIFLSILFYFIVHKIFYNTSKVLSNKIICKRYENISRFEESIISTREIIMAQNENWEKSLYKKEFKDLFKLSSKKTKNDSIQEMFLNLIKWLTTIAIISLCAIKFVNGDLSVGVFVVVYQLSNQLSALINEICIDILKYNESINEISQLRETIDSNYEYKSFAINNIKSIVLENVSFRYNQTGNLLINNVNINIMHGMKIGIIGKSGSGKSTLSKLILNQYKPEHGKIYINGIDIDNFSEIDISSKILKVYQEPYIIPASVLENITFGRNINIDKVIELCKNLNIHEFINKLADGYETYIGERGLKISGGERQKIALARCLLESPEILILDESTSALDVESERNIQKNIDEMRKFKTTIIISHRLSTIQNADIIYVLENGTVIDYGSHDKLLMSCNYYKKLVKNQI